MRPRCRFRRPCWLHRPHFILRSVSRLIEEFRPDVVIFDNAGRTAQLRAGTASRCADRIHQLAIAAEAQGVSLALDAADR